MVDEADVDVVGSLGRGAKRPLSDPGSPKPTNRRKPGPLPKDYTTVRGGSLSPRPSTPTPPPKTPEVPEKVPDENVKVSEPSPATDKGKAQPRSVLGNSSQKNVSLNAIQNTNHKSSPPGSPIGVPNLTAEVDCQDVEMNGISGRFSFLNDQLMFYGKKCISFFKQNEIT